MQNTFAREAYEQKKWAFVSDYARAKVLYEGKEVSIWTRTWN